MDSELVGRALVGAGVVAAGVAVAEAVSGAAERLVAARRREGATVSATGSGSAEAPPDRAAVELDVSGRGEDREEARDAAAETVESVRAALAEADFDGIETAGFRAGTDPETDVAEATQRLTVETTAGRADEAVDVAVEAGAGTVRGVDFYHSAERRMDLRDTALARAIADADDEAGTIADAAGVHLGGLRSVSADGDHGGPATHTMEAMRAGRTDFEPGPVEVYVDVTATYALERRP